LISAVFKQPKKNPNEIDWKAIAKKLNIENGVFETNKKWDRMIGGNSKAIKVFENFKKSSLPADDKDIMEFTTELNKVKIKNNS
jgi:hypothetical protein